MASARRSWPEIRVVAQSAIILVDQLAADVLSDQMAVCQYQVKCCSRNTAAISKSELVLSVLELLHNTSWGPLLSSHQTVSCIAPYPTHTPPARADGRCCVAGTCDEELQLIFDQL
jgi:hypothetical protein